MVVNIDGKEMYSEREKHIIPILKNPKLFKIITDKEVSKKIVGEKETIKTIFLCSAGRLVENAKKTSYNLIVNDESGAGKDWVTERVLEIWGQRGKIWIKRTRITEKVFTYWHNPKFEPEWTWDGKIFYNEDVSNPVLNSDVFKVMASTGSIATVLINQKPSDIEIRGKPILILTIASLNPKSEIARRFTFVNLDLSVDQTKAIMKRQAEYSEKGIKLEYNDKIIEALGCLKRGKVKIAYATQLLNLFPADNILMRTHFERFLDYIKASTLLHQYQREIDKDGYYLAEGKDYDIARIVLLKITSNPKMIPLTKDQKRLLKILRELPRENYSVNDLEPHVTFMSDRWLRKQLKKLSDDGFLVTDSEVRSASDRKVLVYRYIDVFDIKIPEWKKIKRKIRSIRSTTTNRSVSSSASNGNKKQLNDLNQLNGEHELRVSHKNEVKK